MEVEEIALDRTIVDQPAAKLRHDVANELAVIIGFTELLIEDAGGDHAWRQDLHAIRHAAQRATRLLAELKRRAGPV